MPTLKNEQRLVLGLGILLFLLSCAYVPWERRYFNPVFVHKADTANVYVEYRSAAPSETRHGWVFSRPVFTSMFSVPGGGVEMSPELNVQFPVVEWLGICLFTGALIWLLQEPKKSSLS